MVIHSSANAITRSHIVGNYSTNPNVSGPPKSKTAATVHTSKTLSHSMYTNYSSGSEQLHSMDVSTSIDNLSGISATTSHFIAIKQHPSSNDVDSSMLLLLAQEIEEQESVNQNCCYTCCIVITNVVVKINIVINIALF